MAQLSRLLQEVQSPPAPAADQQQPPYHHPQVGRCNYDDFCRLREQAPVAARAHFTEQNFLKVRAFVLYVRWTRTFWEWGN